jgi:hypothetical protein
MICAATIRIEVLNAVKARLYPTLPPGIERNLSNARIQTLMISGTLARVKPTSSLVIEEGLD